MTAFHTAFERDDEEEKQNFPPKIISDYSILHNDLIYKTDVTLTKFSS